MKNPSLLTVFVLTLGLSVAQAQPTMFSDAINDIDPGISTGSGTLDIVKMEVVDTATDVVFTMTVNGSFTAADWGNFMVGIANQKTPGTIIGNGWGRPINLNAGTTNGVTNGMTHWIGSWVSGGGGAQLWTRGETNWAGPAPLVSFSTVAAAQSAITYTVSKESLGVTNGDTIIFDAYSSGGGGGDSAVDALSNPNISITAWSQNYTSTATNLTRSYTLANTALNTTQDITFSVDMNAQENIAAFDPATDQVSVEWGAGFANYIYLTDADSDGIYTGTASVSAPANTPVAYRFVIEPGDVSAPLVPETVSRSFNMPEAPLALTTVYFNNNEGYRDVTFSVNMSVQESIGAFNPATQTVEVRGPFNNWSGTTLTAQGGGIYSGTVQVGGMSAQSVDYKFYTAGVGASGYESISGNRSFTLALNSDGSPTPALVLTTVYFNNQDTIPQNRPVTFSVDMSFQITQGNFVAGTNTLEVRGAFNGWSGGSAWQLADADADGIYTGTFTIIGEEGVTQGYKFFASGTLGWETVPDRSLTLGQTGVAQSVPVVYFNNNSGQTRDVTFSVDMSIQQAQGLFNPATGTVELRGIGSFDAANAQTLTRQGTTLVYSGTFAVPGDAGTELSYKFYSSGVTATGFEIINPNDLFINRTLTLGTSGVAQVLNTSYFSNELFYVTGTPFNAFSAQQGSISSAQSVTVNGQSLAAAILATAPTGFEASSDGASYGPTASISPAGGAVTNAPLYLRLSASAPAGALSGSLVLASTGSQSVTLPVSGTVTAATNGYNNWLTNYPSITGTNTDGTSDPDGDGFVNNVEFAFDGDPTVGTPSLMTVTAAGPNAVFNWVERTNSAVYQVQQSGGLTNAWTNASGLTISNSTNQTGILLAPDYVRREFIVPASGRDFYRIRATITNN